MKTASFIHHSYKMGIAMRKLVALLLLLYCQSSWGQMLPERLHFEIRYGIFKGGEATYETHSAGTPNPNEIKTSLHGYTTGILDKLYPVDDIFESLIDGEKMLPLQSSKKLKEQNFRYTEEVMFDHQNEKAHCSASGSYDVKYGICDVASLFYHMRNSGILNNLTPNQLIELPFWDTGEWYMLRFKYKGIETIETHIGKKRCMRLDPQQIAGRFFNKKNPMNIWISDDNRKLPLLMQLNFTIGSVKCELITTTP